MKKAQAKKQELMAEKRSAQNELRLAKEELLAKKKQELVVDLDNKIQEMQNELLSETKITNAKIMLAMTNKNLMYGTQKLYNAEELMIVFQKYKEIVAMLCDIDDFIPSKENFSAFAGFSTSTYNKYKLANDPALVETMEIIDDYIKEMNLDLSQKKKVDNFTTIFRMKASMGMVETQPVQVVEHRRTANKDKIKEQLRNLNGKVTEAEYEEI